MTVEPKKERAQRGSKPAARPEEPAAEPQPQMNGKAQANPDQNVGAVESINAMLAELQEQNTGLRNRTVHLRGELAKANAIIAKRDATIRDLLAIQQAGKKKN